LPFFQYYDGQMRVMEHSSGVKSRSHDDLPGPSDTDGVILMLERQLEEQKRLRLQDAKQVEAKAAKIKEWVTNKLRGLEEQNQLLRDQNQRCNQQIQLLRSHIEQFSVKDDVPLTNGRLDFFN